MQRRASVFSSKQKGYAGRDAAGTLLKVMLVLLFLGASADAVLVDRIVAVVNGDIITFSELRRISLTYMQRMNQQFKVAAGDEQFQETERRILEQLIDEKLVDQEADRLALTISEREVDMAIKEMQNRNRLTDEQFAAVLAEEGLTMQKYREQLKTQMKKVRLIDQEIKSRIQVSKDEVEGYYARHAADFDVAPSVRIQQIRLIIPPESSEGEIQQIRAKAESILARIKAGEDFTTLVSLYSQDANAAAGGDMGIFKRGELLPAIDEHVFNMKPGEVTPIIRTEGGFHIIRLLEKQEPAALSDEERKNAVKEMLFEQKAEEDFKEWIAKLRKKAYIEINL